MAADARFRYLRAVLSLRELLLRQNEMVLARSHCPGATAWGGVARLRVDLPAGAA